MCALFPHITKQLADRSSQIDDDSEDDDSGSDIRSGPPRKRRKNLSSGRGKFYTTMSLRSICTSDTLFAYSHFVGSKQNTPSAQSPSESESDIDAYGGSRRAAAKKNHRRSVQPTRDITPTHGEVRFSTRKAAKVSNYNEDDDDMFDDEADMVPQGYWPTGPEENVPAIDAVLNHRLREDTGQRDGRMIVESETNTATGKEVTDPGRDDFEYYVSAAAAKPSTLSRDLASDEHKIKWQGKAHYHSTWEINATLASCRGIRRLENYFRKTVQEDIHMKNEKDIPLEEQEKWNLDRERDADALKDYTKVERVIGMKEDEEEGETLYLVKCKFSNHIDVNTKLTQDREGTLLRFVHLGGWQPD